MAALCTGNYGLSQNCTDNGKELFFVKLTDSAYRAVEDYQKNQGKNNTQATIQIVGNGGVLSFPSAGHIQQFRFSIDEIEGSFECIKQTQNQLEVQGALPYKLRIHANDDVYETTRHRMAVAEENQKNKCTREIKPNQTDIGRKVKLKNPGSRVSNIPSKRDQLLTSTTSQSPLSSSTSSTTINSINPVSSTQQQQQLSTGSASSLNLGSTFTTGNSTISPLQSSSSLSISSSGTQAGLSSTNSAFSSISPLHTINNTSLKNSNSNLNSNSSLNSLTSNNNSTSSKLHSSYNHNNNLHQNNSTSSSSNLTGVSSASSLSSALSSAAGSGTSGIASSYYSSNNSSGVRASNGMAIGSNSINNNGGSRRNATGPGMNNRNQRNGNRHMPDITKKKIRDRLIHLLALKPFKKPELYTRLQNEGIREREKASLVMILKEISIIRDNSYNLKRQLWNDVNEDWPFYTEQELQMLKRRKPQNLTPPLSSDGGSSTSGQSPTSTHNGSPPPAVKRPSLDRDRFYEEPAAKKQRISHFRKDNNEINSSNIPMPTSNKHHQEPEDNAMSISYGVLESEAARRISPRELVMNGHSNSNSGSNNSSNSHHHNIPNSHHHNANNNNTNSSNKNNSNNTIMSSSGNAHHKSPTPYSHQNSNSNVCNTGNNSNSSRIVDSRRKSSSSPMTASSAMNALNVGIGGSSSGSVIGVGGGGISSGAGVVIGASSPGAGSRTTNMNVSIPMTGLNDRGSAINRCEITNNLNNNNNVNHGSNNSGSITNSSSTSSGQKHAAKSNHVYDFSGFTKISSVEQRRQYKAEFEKNYKEYRDLLIVIEGVAKKFNELALQLEDAKNDPATHREIRRKILNEYEKTNRDRNHQTAKERFDYLHAKLAHIKALVQVFDHALTAPNGSGSVPNSDMNQSPIQNIADFSGNMNISNGFSSNNNNNSSSSRSGGNLSSHRTSPIGGPTGAQNLHHHLPENY